MAIKNEWWRINGWQVGTIGLLTVGSFFLCFGLGFVPVVLQFYKISVLAHMAITASGVKAIAMASALVSSGVLGACLAFNGSGMFRGMLQRKVLERQGFLNTEEAKKGQAAPSDNEKPTWWQKNYWEVVGYFIAFALALTVSAVIFTGNPALALIFLAKGILVADITTGLIAEASLIAAGSALGVLSIFTVTSIVRNCLQELNDWLWMPKKTIAGGAPVKAGGGPANPGAAALAGLGGPANPGGVAANPGGVAANPGGVAANPGGVAANPGGVAANPGGVAANPGGVAANPGGAPANAGGVPANAGGVPANAGGVPANAGGAPANPGRVPAAMFLQSLAASKAAAGADPSPGRRNSFS